jgi:hypothetical protein
MEVRAVIEPTPSWKMVESCGFERCYPMVDNLIGKDISIRIVSNEATKAYVMRMEFSSIKSPMIFNASNVKGISDSANVNARIYYCDAPLLNYSSMRTASALNNGVSITKNECFLLFFDHPAFLTERVVTLDMTDALLLDGKPLNVPLVNLIRANKPIK